MTKTISHCVVAGAVAAATLALASPAMAQAGCGYYRPAPFTFMREHPAPCPYQGPYMVKSGPTYDGPALIAPQPTYSPSRTINFVHGAYPAQAVAVETEIRPVTRQRQVNVRSELPPSKGKPQFIRANAEVRIYGPERMDIKLYRR